MTPVGGTGLNTAVHAGHNLGWKLAWVLRGWAAEELLDSYEFERRRPGGRRRSLRLAARRARGAGGTSARHTGPRWSPWTRGSGRRTGGCGWPAAGYRRWSLFDGRLTLLAGRDAAGVARPRPTGSRAVLPLTVVDVPRGGVRAGWRGAGAAGRARGLARPRPPSAPEARSCGRALDLTLGRVAAVGQSRA